ncbi:MAG TPA: response regulator [Terriglobia bacterium]|nr:response regulator [Terriglobia bacterium]
MRLPANPVRPGLQAGMEQAAAPEPQTVEVRLRCKVCWDEGPVALNPQQVEQLRTCGHLEMHCRYCKTERAWEAVDPTELIPKPALAPTAPKRVLLVDPDPASLALLQRICGAWEAHIEVAQNAEEGMRKLAEASYDLLISEMRLSDMPAEGFLKFIRDNLLLSPEQIIFLGRESPHAVHKFVAANGCGYCRKPLQFTELSQEVEARLCGNDSEEATTTAVIL